MRMGFCEICAPSTYPLLIRSHKGLSLGHINDNIYNKNGIIINPANDKTSNFE